MKKLRIIILLVVMAAMVAVTAYAQTETMTLTTYYPAPLGFYSQLRLVPRDGAALGPPVTCDNASRISALGVMWLDSSLGVDTLKICQDDGTGTGTLAWMSVGSGGGGSLWARTGSNLYPTNIGDNVGVGTAAPEQKLHIEGAFPTLLIKGTGAPGLVLRDTDAAGGSWPYIAFSGNEGAAITGDDSSQEIFGFYSAFTDPRSNDAEIRIHGKGAGWGNYLSLTHDGTDGIISTDIGNIAINPERGASPKGVAIGVPDASLNNAQALTIGNNVNAVDWRNKLGYNNIRIGGAGALPNNWPMIIFDDANQANTLWSLSNTEHSNYNDFLIEKIDTTSGIGSAVLLLGGANSLSALFGVSGPWGLWGHKFEGLQSEVRMDSTQLMNTSNVRIGRIGNVNNGNGAVILETTRNGGHQVLMNIDDNGVLQVQGALASTSSSSQSLTSTSFSSRRTYGVYIVSDGGTEEWKTIGAWDMCFLGTHAENHSLVGGQCDVYSDQLPPPDNTISFNPNTQPTWKIHAKRNGSNGTIACRATCVNFR
ncbi:MAG TPA: hypothetical protein PL155_02890 [Candidatus Omnitrophota bacterium]|nr:hypothetical protein [Candidatus Omnitrophota bacterium]HPD84570.1 hypothetical protein [Candidatus Omnitrophota bacterium]HRZ03428.1 hypothetical protein [Candidatus Omnitrophota bacterium]